MTEITPAAATAPGLAVGQQISASVVNSFRVAAVAERLATHTQPGRQAHSTEFFGLCLSLARGIDYAIANNEVPAKVQELPLLLKQICQRRNDLFLHAAIMVLMISVKNACKMSWFSDQESQELYTLANEVGSCFCSPGDINNGLDDSHSTILAVMSRFYPLMKMGQILASLEAKPGYAALVVDFHISKNTMHSPLEKIRLFVAQKDNIETSACIISPQQVNFLLNGKGVERRTNVLMDMGPQMPTNVTAMLKYGTNLLQAVGQFWGHYIIVIAFMSMESSPDTSVLQDYVRSGDVAPNSEDSDIIEGPSRISLKCPISKTRIKTPVKGLACKHLQCFDFNNYVDINSRRPSWRCPHCNQHVCYTDIRVDQNMVKVLKEVAEDVSDVIISADGSWKVVLENDDDVEELHDKVLNCRKDGSEQPESAKGVPIILDLTQDDNEVDAMETFEIEDRKPTVANLQSQSAPPNLTITPERATQMARQPPMVAAQTQTLRAPSSAVEQRLNIGGLAPAASRADTTADLASEQNWRPAGRMRGSLSGRAYSSALSELMIQPTQSAQAARPQTNLTSSPSVPPHLQALLASRRNAAAAPQMQNNAMTDTAGMNGSSSILPDGSGGML
ncbi:hypothetical protein REPUB_Repub08aG0175000 [Reevesia pubescens]